MADEMYAGIGKRILAYFFDSVILGVAAIPVAFIGLQALPPRTAAPLLQVLFAVIMFAYFIYFEGRSGQTPGKSVMNIAVRKENDEPMTIGAAAVRNVLRVVDGLFLYLVGIVVIALSDDSQRIGDMIADTVVVKTGPWEEEPPT